MKRECILTGITFDTRDRDQLICPVARKAIVDLIKEDKQLRKEVSANLLGDTEVVIEIAKAVMTVDAVDVGLSHPGSISEFFLAFGEEVGK